MTLNNIFYLGVIFRLILYCILIFFPFYHNEQGYFGSFILQNADLDDYLFVTKIITLNNNPFDLSCPSGSKCNLLPVSVFINNFYYLIDSFFNFLRINDNIHMIVGPVFPIIILLTDYSEFFPYALSLTCFISEIAAFYLWLSYLKKNVSWQICIIFALFPFTILFGLIHSPDIITYFFLSVLILNRIKGINISNFFYFLLLTLVVFTKPIGLFLIFYFIIFDFLKDKKIYLYSLFLFIIGIIYYLPYFFVEISKSDISVFPELQLILENIVIDRGSLIFSAIFYLTKFILLFGFDFSQSGNNYIYLFKIPSAFLLLLGFLINHKNKNNFLKYFVYIYVLIIVLFFYPTFRYILPVIPLLILNLSFYSKIFFNIFFKSPN